jgi:pimeloyl-ACP methyl ester carboxylesterase
MTTLIFIPGLACDAEVFADVLAAWPTAPLDLHITDAIARADTIAAMAAAVLAEAPPGPLALVGHSMGGMVAMHAALRAEPGRLRALALLATSARADTPELVALRTAACEEFAAGRIEAVLDANVPFAFHPQHAADAALVARYKAIVLRAGAERLIRQNRAVMAREDLRARLAQIRCSVLVAAGEGDGLTPPEMAHEIAAALPAAELHLLPRCGHMLTLEQPSAVAALLDAWWRGVCEQPPLRVPR